MRNGSPPVMKRMRSTGILVVDDEEPVLRSFSRQLTDAGFLSVKTATNLDDAWRIVAEDAPEAVLMDIRFPGEYRLDGLDFIRKAVDTGYSGRVAVISNERSLDEFYRALAAGAQDYWCKGGDLDVVAEVVNLLDRPPTDPLTSWDPGNIGRLGYFRTRGLPEPFRKALLEYARDFSRYHDVADRMERSPKQIKKTMAEAQDILGVRSLGELGKLLTACELMGRRPHFVRGNR